MNTFYSREYAASVIDIIEDFLEAKGVELPKTEDAELDDNSAIIYGEDYDELATNISSVFTELIEAARPDVTINEYDFGTSDFETLDEEERF